MATTTNSAIEYYQERLDKAIAKAEKCKGTIERHKKQLDKKIQIVSKAVGIDLTGKTKEEIDELKQPYAGSEESWKFYDVKRKLEDIKGAERKLQDAEEIVGNWQEKLTIEINREKFIQENAPKVIKDFLEEWKKLAYEWTVKRYHDYQEFKAKLDKEEKAAKAELGIERGFFPSKAQEAILREKKLDYRSIEARKAEFAGGTVLFMDGIYKEEERLKWLDNTLEREKRAKLMDLILRISKVVGEIQDATYLEINQKGNLDGFVIGDKGKARVDTIGAGGWNIVCFHYRTLVKPVKEIKK